MFRHSATTPSSYGGDAFMQSFSSAAALATVPTQIPRPGAVGYLDGGNVGGAFPPFAAASSPPSSTYSSSLPSSYYNNIHRSISSHSLPLHLHQLGDALNGGGAFFSSSSPSPHQLSSLAPMSSSPSSSCHSDLFDFASSCSVRRVFSTGDLQGMNGSSPAPSGDSCGGQDVGGGPFSQKVGRYSAEERKERVERYRVKRHQRNFTKKITYACRKSLADSRPRVKGRFARNGETEAENDDHRPETSDNSYDYCGGYSNNHSCKVDSAATAAAAAFVGDNGEWWWPAPGAAVAEEEEAAERQVGFDVDEELWATLGDMLSVNLAS
ncbi:two-component response regulator-like APRR5 isoform X2 [Brachypodium distachyon]|uniref:CCT domain-containing protein n=1 Tax=Brachypodium distachyon TaxID=15368 RepID=A0A0Q3RBJ2_BRADI|nr:two-component response regulator-like APRR5 isoform X2 [Brachypodium distachyon]KQK10466.1 hypothetical protein BRADI_2g54260v3 [Brachypodium distachyon]|eukprot:XP_003564556.1 two-component response regulator-like APRR5 isoform X2 [Brachypodium distachyon]